MEKTIEEVLAKGKSTLETVCGVKWWTDKLFTFTTTKPADYSFTAGQYARLGMPDEHGAIWRAYSMTSAPSDMLLEFYGILVPGGLFTSKLKDIAPGSKILIEKQPFGFMTVDRFADGEDLWMLATGTGIGPFISILRDPLVWQRFNRLILVHCVRTSEEFTYRQELDVLTCHPSATHLKVIRTSTRDDASALLPGALHGRITTLIENGGLEAAAGRPLVPEPARVMLCGNPDMIEETRRLLHERGMRPVRRAAPGQFVTENYW